MTLGSRRLNEDREQGRTNILHSFADVALLLSRVKTGSELHSAREQAASWLARQAALPAAVGEVGFGASGLPRLLWCSREGGLSISGDEDLSKWYEHAARHAGELCVARGKNWRGLLSAGEFSSETGLRTAVLFEDGVVDPEVAVNASQIAALAESASVYVRKSMASALEKRHLLDLVEDTTSWLALEVDIVWEAGPDGIIRVRRILNGRKDLGAMIDGGSLASIKIDGERSLLGALQEFGSVRHFPIEADGAAGRNETFLVSARMNESAGSPGSCIGTITAAKKPADGLVRQTAAMMVQMRDARLREERQRREAEAMLQGLRLLLGPDASREKLSRLVALVCGCIGASAARVVQRGLDGSVRFLMPREQKPGGEAEAAFDLILNRSGAGSAVAFDLGSREGAMLTRSFGIDGRHAAALPLPLRGEAAFLICVTSRDAGFSSSDLDFADRLTLLLRQALLLGEEQNQLAQTAKMAALGQMSASIAHELRQPLNTISLAVQNLELLLQAPEVDEAAIASKTKRVLAQVERASEVIDRMRRFGRKSTGDQSTVSLCDLVENVEAIMHHVLLRAGIRLETEIPEELSVIGDQLQFEQVLGNLIQNAVDAISGIGAKHERSEGLIRLRAEVPAEEKAMVILRVEDSGPGFRQEILDRVLEPFFTTKSAEHGTGLGLAICNTIIRESGGRIELGNHEAGGYVALILPREIA
ncbi:sensor histidine kinase [Parvibaculum sp.]|uniref:sensor histidine kinase n=1 Tax=Parvibaculum sp. TaxID=2024848 RepID=UPI00391B8A82